MKIENKDINCGILKTAKDLLAVQGADGNWNHDPYMHGLYNGMEFIISLYENRTPIFRDAPEKCVDKLENCTKFFYKFLNFYRKLYRKIHPVKTCTERTVKDENSSC